MKIVKSLIIGILALVIGLPAVSLAETQEIKIADDFSIDVDESWIVMKSDDLTSDATAKGYEIDEEYYKSVFEGTNFDVLLLSVEPEDSGEPLLIGVGSMVTSDQVNSLRAMDEDGLLTQSFLEELLINVSDMYEGYTAFVQSAVRLEAGDYIFISYLLSPDDPKTQNYITVYTTVENHNSYFFDVSSSEPLQEKSKERVEQIVKTSKIDLDPEFSENDELMEQLEQESGPSYMPILARVVWGVIILAIIVVIADRRNRRRAREEALANKINEHIQQTPEIDSVIQGHDDSVSIKGCKFTIKRAVKRPLKVSGRVTKGKRLNG